MVRYKIVFAYDGSKFCGFQRQVNLRTVQGEIEKSISEIVGSSVNINGAGRTDAGVHAYGQVASFDVPYKIFFLKRKLNKNLVDIKIRNVKIVSTDFHARYSAIGKKYVYKIK